MKRILEFDSHPANLAGMRQFIRDFLKEKPLGEMEADLIVLGIDEACANIIRYAYKEECNQPISITCEELKGRLRFKVRDFGLQGDPNTFHSRELSEPRPGGLGIHLIRKAFDRVDYTLRKRGTELVLTKNLPASPRQ